MENIDEKKFLKNLEKVKDDLPEDVVEYLRSLSSHSSSKGMKSAILHSQKKMINFCLELDWLSNTL